MKSRRGRRNLAALSGGTLVVSGLGVIGAPQASATTTYSVTNTADSGPGSLRQAIIDANANAGADLVNIDSGLSGQITLTTGQLNIASDVFIQGPGANRLTVSGNHAS